MTSANGVNATAWPLTIDDLHKTYRRGAVANDGISIHINPGEVYGLLGPNGAGKTTLVKQVIGLLKPTSGSITLGPYDLVADPAVARQLCSYLPQAPMPIDSLNSRPRAVWKNSLTMALMRPIVFSAASGSRGRKASPTP